MKNAFLSSLVLIALLSFSFSGCKKKSTTDETPTPTNNNGTFTCTINGAAFAADSATYMTNATQTFILAFKQGRGEFEINLNGKTATTYNIMAGSNDFIYWPSSSTFSGASTGSIIITKFDNTLNKVSGTFSGISTTGTGGNFTISDGNFTAVLKK